MSGRISGLSRLATRFLTYCSWTPNRQFLSISYFHIHLFAHEIACICTAVKRENERTPMEGENKRRLVINGFENGRALQHTSFYVSFGLNVLLG